jgi:hypothetical protein
MSSGCAQKLPDDDENRIRFSFPRFSNESAAAGDALIQLAD